MTDETVKMCSREGCTNEADPRSTKGYCTACMKQARAAWREMVRASAEEAAQKRVAFARVWDEAVIAGARAAAAVKPAMMDVIEAATGEVVATTNVKGFAWLHVVPANSAFANWLKDAHGAVRCSGGGVQVTVFDYGQDVALKTAHVNAMAEVLDKGPIGNARVRAHSMED